MTNNISEIVSTRTTFDGVTVYLHADGSVSDRRSFVCGGRLPVADMWRAWDSVSIYTHAEIPDFIRSEKGDKRAKRRLAMATRKPMTEEDHERILSLPSRRGVWVDGCLIPIDIYAAMGKS